MRTRRLLSGSRARRLSTSLPVQIIGKRADRALRVRRARIMRADLPCRRALVETHEAVEEVVARQIVVGSAPIVGERGSSPR